MPELSFGVGATDSQGIHIKQKSYGVPIYKILYSTRASGYMDTNT